MSKIKYTEEIKQKAIRLRLEGKSSPEITAITGMGKESQNKLFRERNIKMSPEAAAKARERRWLNYEPIQNGQKECSCCGKLLPVSEFGLDNSKISKLASWCKTCNHDYYEKNSDHIKARVKVYKSENPEKVKDWDRKRYLEKTQEYIDNAAKWHAENPDKRKKIQHDYDQRTQPKKNSRTALYRARKKKATPPWLSQQQLDEMKRIYENCPPGYEVDHIIPLRGKNVSGLHVPWNLQYLTAEDNNKKGNRI